MFIKLKTLKGYSNEEGFTLVEVIIVVLVLGIIAAIAIPVFSGQQRAGIVGSIKSDIKNTVTELSAALVKRPQGIFLGTAIYTSQESKIGLDLPVAQQKPFQMNIIVSDPGTLIQFTGTWKKFYVLGVNNNIGPYASFSSSTPANGETTLTMTATGTQFGAFYDSATGKLTIRGG